MTPEARVQQIAAQVKKTATKHNYKPSSHAYASYVRGAWVVAAREHPEVSSLKSVYLKALGVIA